MDLPQDPKDLFTREEQEELTDSLREMVRIRRAAEAASANIPMH